MATSAHFLKRSAEKRGVADVNIEEGTEGLTDRHRRPVPSVSGRKIASPGPYFPGTFHSMDAVRKHTLSIGSK